ncbi:MAG: hypothetical protein ACLS6G_08395 [Christensenellales bacterium]
MLLMLQRGPTRGVADADASHAADKLESWAGAHAGRRPPAISR